jgi:hypothetical protein
MSDVESYWQAIAAKFGDNRKWTDLQPQEQHLVINSINQLLAVLHRLV